MTHLSNTSLSVAAFCALVVACPACGGVAAACAPHAQAPRPIAAAGPTDFHYEKAMSSPGSVEIRAISGAITAAPATDGVLRVDAEKIVEDGGDAADVRVVAVEHGGGVLVCALLRDQDDSACAPGDDDHGGESHGGSGEVRVRTDFTVHVPARVRFEGRTMNGEIEAEDLASDVRALTMNGAIVAVTSGAVEARTMNGDIDAAISGGLGPFVFETMNGDVSVKVPASLDADVRASTMRGSIDSDFALPESSGYGPSEASGRIGAGGVRIEASTMNGDVSIHQSGRRAETPHEEEDE